MTTAAYDIYSTQRILDEGGYEKNPILGRHPNDEAVFGVIVSGRLISIGLAELFPKYRSIFYGAGCVVGVANGVNNTMVLNE